MRTTITIDDELAGRLEEERHRRGESFKKALNRILRLGLMAAARERESLTPFVVQPYDLGLREGLNYDNVADLLEQLEGPEHR